MYVENSKGINFNEYQYLKKMFEMLKVGTEIEVEFERNVDVTYSTIRDEIGKMGRGYAVFGINTSGVSDVKGDGSLVNGCEIVTNGRLLHSPSLFHAQYNNIYNSLPSIPLVSARCGMHQHVLISSDSNLGSQLEVNLNTTLFKNICILFKNNIAGMTWLTCALYKSNADRESYTRYDGFNKWTHMYDRCLNELDSDDIVSLFSSNSRYCALNLQPMNIVDNEIRNLHVEFRFPDGFVVPSQVVLQNFMLNGLMKLALDLSLGGELIDVNEKDGEYYNKMITLKNNPTNSTYPDTEGRYSNNTGLDVEYFRNEAHKFVDSIKKYVPVNVYYGLKELADKNISERLKEGMSREEIEEELSIYLTPKTGKMDENIVRKVISGEIDITTLETASICADKLKIDFNEVKDVVEKLRKTNLI